jgi:spore coat polysaccharide biosynthesis predicted glycosyltransferase SpsG/CMP-N-acetylneuraminic acid synthetase
MPEPTDDSTAVLALVPARGGSSTLPRKNMRTLGGRPLVSHIVEALRASQAVDRIVVSTEDREVRVWAGLHDCEVHERTAEMALDDVDLCEVAATVADQLDAKGIIGVFAPNTPFCSPASISAALRRFRASSATSLSSCVRVQRVHWHAPEGDPIGATELMGPQETPFGRAGGVFGDNGAIYLIRASALRGQRRLISDDHMLFEMPAAESLRINSVTELIEARRRVTRGTIVFRMRANHKVGSGHAFRCLQLADELADQNVCFLLKDGEDWVEDMIRRFNYRVIAERDLASDLARLAPGEPRLVVNDVLNTHEAEILIQRTRGFKVVTIEDLGPGARFADWVVNALYRPQTPAANTVWGARYATLRDEFHDLPPKRIRDRADDVLLAFGGTDPTGLGPRCAQLLSTLDMNLHVVLGPGASDTSFPPGIKVSRAVPSMAQAMLEADLMVTSAGRTVYEAARTGTPVVVLAQNAREATHAHVGYESGVVFLGIGTLVGDGQIIAVVRRMLGDAELRRELSRTLQNSIDDDGARRIGSLIRELLYDSRPT